MTLTENLLQKALKALPTKQSHGHNKTLLRELSKQISRDDMDYFSADLLAEIIQTHGELALKRESEKAQFKIYSPKAQTSGGHRTIIIDVVSDDLAFLVDSVVAEINKHNFLIDLLLHPVIYSQYDDNGKLTDVTNEAKDGYIQQSHIHIQIKNVSSDSALKSLEKGIEEVLKDVRYTNQDWDEMQQALQDARMDLANAKTRRPLSEVQQYCAFLDYLYDNNFTLLGYREYKFVEKDGETKSQTVHNSGLGLLKSEIRPAYISDREEGLPRNLQEKRKNLPPLSISKTNRHSTVHRAVPMDAVAIKTYDEKGNVSGERLFLGLFTSVTYSRSVSDVPYLREKVEEVIELSGSIPHSHNRKALRHILEKYPRDELFQIEPQKLLEIATDILRLQERQRIALFMRKDPFRRYISCLVYVPRDRYATSTRKIMCTILEEELGGVCTNFSTLVDDSVFARVMFTINIRQDQEPKFNQKELEAKLQEAGETWQERLARALNEAYIEDEQNSNLKNSKYTNAFPIPYTLRYKASQAVFDIEKIETALSENRLQLDLYRINDMENHRMRLKVYNPGAPLNLSDVMPILDYLGLKAISELPYEIKPDSEDKPVWIHDFLLETPDQTEVTIEDVKKNFEAGFSRIWNKQMENDKLNKLILHANMTWRQVTLLRAYVRYMRQIRFQLSRPFVEKALNAHPEISHMIVSLFKALHYPRGQETAAKEAAKIKKSIEAALDKVESLDHDRCLRMMTALVEATLRTNYFQRDEEGERKTYMSIKFDCQKIPDMPLPRPYREIFVYSPRVEGVHLRGDKIARGGLRWSDRPDDFRTEVLGLMKAQMVKNSVIVPMGAKGGFVLKRPPSDREAFKKEGIECYKTFIRGLLDITDNRKGTKIIPPKDTVCLDEPDPYLVVAADKGTASFSDIANGISQDYGFWLDDAFASGGSAGYDHKKMGITARGAWESVKIHFRELGHNTQEKPFDVVGVGDMGGDVFGNGMLCSEHIRLLAAFNHLHIFVDPDPDPKSSFKERQRLFDNVLGWADYDQSKLSKGGKIYDRSEKSLKLTPEIKERFDLQKDTVTPGELMRAILKSRTDLIWFGGIGTYVKAQSESNADAGDKANDSIRVNANELRAKVIGEGANLGTTQLGRIEFAKNGGHINTDFVDNSGGVNSSDLEVNIKILLSDVMNSKEHNMDIKARNKLLETMTEDVSQLVLRNNYQQAQAISLATLQAKNNLQIHNEFIRQLERDKGLSRALEGLPDEEEVERRLRAGRGLTHPELCILLSYAKIGFTQDLLGSKIPDSPDMSDWLIEYFPDAVQKKYETEIKRHRLGREIIATQMANSLINRMGPTFLKEKMNSTGAKVSQIAKAYIIVRDIFSLQKLWGSIESLDNKVPAEVQLKAMNEIANLSEHNISWFLSKHIHDLDIATEISNYHDNIAKLQSNLLSLLPPSLSEFVKQRMENELSNGLPKDLAHLIAIMPVMSSACDIIKITLEQKTDLLETAKVYFEIGELFHMSWLRRQARNLPTDTPWQYEATNGLINQMYKCQAALTVRILSDIPKSKAKDGDYIEKWQELRAAQLQKLKPLFTSLRRSASMDISMLITAEQRLNALAEAA
ncbi:MAG: glutamate dehydrogenase [Micavibrio sp.]|nr:glutamate dehydrogenase [Micavibrio sp.]